MQNTGREMNMDQSWHAFSGSNTADGFYGYFSSLQAAAERTVIIKGGPGVGKSTLMKKVAAQYEQKGLSVHYYHCSGDPDSLDAVFVQENGFLMVDGTSPHVLDPVRPGARDGILNLGVCLHEEKLARQMHELDDCYAAVSAAFARAYHYLKAAAAVRADSADVYAAAFPADKRRRLQNELLSLVPENGTGQERHAFMQAITWKGMEQYPERLEAKQVIGLDLPWGMDGDTILQPVYQLAGQRQLDIFCWHDPLEGKKIAHLHTGDVLFTLAAPGNARLITPDLDRDLLRTQSSRLSFNRAVYDLCLHQAVEVLAEAKQAHDRLERYYIDAMDFGRLQAITKEVLEELP